MKLYLDDVREAPEGWVLVTNVDDCMEVLWQMEVTELSLDHDLGTDPETGYTVLVWLEKYPQFAPPVIKIHSANPSVYKKMEQAIESIEKRRCA